MTRTLRPWLAGIALGLFWVSVASAEPSAEDRATARSLATEGYWALRDKRYAEAADRFSRADALVHAPTLTLDWARSLMGLGRLVEAAERYELIIREGVDPKAPPSWQRALSDAKTELAALRPRLSWVTITVTGGGTDANVTIDGVAVSAAALGVRRAINPGAHDFAVAAKGYLGGHQALSLAEGEENSVTLELKLDPDQQQPEPVIEAPKPEPVAPAPPTRNHTPAYVAFGVGAAGLVVGSVSGILWLSKRATLEKHCPNSQECPPDQSDNVDAYHTLSIVAPTGFAVAAAGIATGITLWALEGSSASPARGLVVRPYVGVGSIGARGSF
ncbi:MAG TPA: hypothetical protein VER11_31300 [Polyangiaceae bacterium]|nr:hypothetical protein [Polyangiaceae bacterium]